jgi:hypothetical protein
MGLGGKVKPGFERPAIDRIYRIGRAWDLSGRTPGKAR